MIWTILLVFTVFFLMILNHKHSNGISSEVEQQQSQK